MSTLPTPAPSTSVSAPADRDEALPVVRPRVDIYENDDELMLVAEVPGARADDLSVKLERRMLLIEATGSFSSGDGDLVACEFAPVRYRRAYTLQTAVDADGITASLKDGLLTLRLPRAAADRPRKIDVIEA